LAKGIIVHGFDGMTDYYDVSLKRKRHAILPPCDLLFHRVKKSGNGGLFVHRQGIIQSVPAAYQIEPKAAAFSDFP
jgi:hypothetical protein